MLDIKRREVIEKVEEAGVVGAGGAGFPTYIKIAHPVEIVIANIAECEPLLYKDKEIAKNFADELLTGIETAMMVTGAREGIFAVKKKHEDVIDSLKKKTKSGISLFLLNDYYPVGDEVVLTYDVTERVVPQGNIPINVGVLVLNAETLYNISKAVKGIPVTEKFITAAGEVDKPVTIKVPVGITVEELMKQLNIDYKKQTIFVDGLMMGEVIDDMMTPITKKTSSIIILPSNHHLVLKRIRDVKDNIRIVKSACDQCSYCTEFCPRYLLGHRVEPHRVMRTLSVSRERKFSNIYAIGCIGCRLCSFFACPEGLSPDVVMKKVKKMASAEKLPTKRSVHPMREFRKVPMWKLLKRLAIEKYEKPALLSNLIIKPVKIRLPLIQHIGKPTKPVKKTGDRVKVGDVIAETDKGGLGTKIHTSITGIIEEINEREIIIKRA